MKKRLGIAVILSVVISLMIELIAAMVAPPKMTVRIPSDARDIYAECPTYSSGLEQSSGEFIPTDSDPQIGIELPNEPLQTVIVRFSRPLPQRTAMQAYYAKEGEILSEDRMVGIEVPESEEYAVFELPQQEYALIRLDINGRFSLASVYASNQAPEYAEIPEKLHVVRIFARAAVYTLLCAAALLLGRLKEPARRAMRSVAAAVQKKKRLVSALVLALLVLLIVCQINNSSMECMRSIVPNNIEEVDFHSLGKPRPIRSDEYNSVTPIFFHDSYTNYFKNLIDNADSIFDKINVCLQLVNPYYLIRALLPVGNAFSFQFLFEYLVAFYAFYKLFEIITRSKPFSVAGAFILIFSPGQQWWWGPKQFGMLCCFIVLFHGFFECDARWKKVLHGYALVCLTGVYIPQIYPAWDIPLLYLYVLILLGVYLNEKRINIHKEDIPYIVVVSAFMLLIIASYFISERENTALKLSTEYPGQRFTTGGKFSTSSLWINYLLMPFTPWRELSFSGSNLSEISASLSLFPIPFVLFLIRFREFKRNKAIVGILAFCCVCMFYIAIGFSEFAAKITLFSYTTGERLSTVFGFASLILLLLECYFSADLSVSGGGTLSLDPPSREGASTPAKARWSALGVVRFVVLFASVIATLAWVAIKRPDYVSYMGTVEFGYVAIGLLALAALLFFGKKKAFLAAMCVLTCMTGLLVNPINFGTEVLTDTNVAKEIRRIDAEDPGRWLGVDNFFTPKYVYAQGVDCVNSTSWPPRFDLFKPVDPDGAYFKVYNRYAYVVVILTEEETTFTLNYEDAFTVYLNVEDLAKWQVKYVVRIGAPLTGTENVALDLIYHDDLDNVNIYKVSYRDATDQKSL